MKRPQKKWLILAGAVVIVALIAVAVFSRRDKNAAVEVEPVTARNLTAVVSASGTLEPKHSVSISATTSGEVVRVDVTEGQRVTTGDFLLQLDPVNVAAGASGQEAAVGVAQAELASAEAQLAFATEEFDRKRRLADADLIPRAELDAARAELRARRAAVGAAKSRIRQNEAMLRSAKHDLSQVTITSPIDGVVTRVNVEPGEVAMIGTMNQPGTVLLVIADLGIMEATIDVDETDVVDLEIGQRAEVTVDAFPDTTFIGHVTEVGTSPKIVATASGPSDDSTDFEVVVTLDGELPSAQSGLSCSSEIVTAQRENVLTIPIQSLVVRPVADDAAGSDGVVEREGVFVVRDGTARFTAVRVGISGERYFEIRSGLEENDQVVSGSYQALRDLADGDAVKIER
ncbi:MAG: efflux RND transporter periplasmic adaptor subunit, partial [Gemmatimonadetes bacterium]|nr:efflux RND transporter periplasmic adaptor subunit [Gemmatimonadota bacterium]